MSSNDCSDRSIRSEWPIPRQSHDPFADGNEIAITQIEGGTPEVTTRVRGKGTPAFACIH